MIVIKEISSRKIRNVVYEKYVIQDLKTGFGNTAGNALRRTILSFTPGISIYGIEFSCFKHEFDVYKGIYEDASQIVERFRYVKITYDESFPDTPQEIKIKISGIQIFKAGDIKLDNLNIKVVNTDFVLFNIVEDIEIELKLYLNKSVGFQICKENSNKFQDNQVLGVTSVYSRINVTSFQLLDKSCSLLDGDQVTITVEHEDIYKIGFILLNALTKMESLFKNIKEAYHKYHLDTSNNPAIRIEILNIIEEKYGNEIANFFNKQNFNSYEEIDSLLSKLTYKKCKMTKDKFHELCHFIKHQITGKEDETQNTE